MRTSHTSVLKSCHILDFVLPNLMYISMRKTGYLNKAWQGIDVDKMLPRALQIKKIQATSILTLHCSLHVFCCLRVTRLGFIITSDYCHILGACANVVQVVLNSILYIFFFEKPFNYNKCMFFLESGYSKSNICNFSEK